MSDLDAGPPSKLLSEHGTHDEIPRESGTKRPLDNNEEKEETINNDVIIPAPRRSKFSDAPATQSTMSIETQQHVLGNPALSALLNGLANLPPPLPSLGPKEQRELFVGNVPCNPPVSENELKDFLNKSMRDVGLATDPVQDPIINLRMSAKFSFIELRSIDDCNNALNLNGIPYHGQILKISRPSKYVGPITLAKTWQQITGDVRYYSI